MTGMPVDDPQFWWVSAIVLATTCAALWALLRSRRMSAGPSCSRCAPPQASLQSRRAPLAAPAAPKTADQRESTTKGSPPPLP